MNVIIVTVEELESLIDTAKSREGLVRFEEAYWTKKVDEAKQPLFLGRAEDGMAVYELRFTL